MCAATRSQLSAYAKQPKPDPGVSLRVGGVWLVKLVFTGLTDRSARSQPATRGRPVTEEKLAKRTEIAKATPKR